MFRFELLKRFKSCDRGTVAVVFGLTFVALIGFVGLSIDVGSWVKKRSDLVSAADFGALAGARALADALLKKDDDTAETIAKTTALKYVAENGGAAATPNVSVSINRPYGVTVTLNENGKQYFSKAVGQSAPDIGVVSVAVAERQSDACVLALDQNASPGIEFGLSGDVVAHGCSIWSNSDTALSMDGKGDGTVTSDWNCAVGTATITSALDLSPSARSNCLPVVDPFADWTPPVAPTTCLETNLVLDKPGNYTLWPGKYCNGLTIKGGAVVTFQPGIYFIDGKDLLVEGGGSMIGDDVSFILTGGAAANVGGGGEIDLAAPTTGDTASLVFAAGRDAPKAESILRGSSLFRLEGHVYLPTHHLRYAGGPDGGYPADYTKIIAGTIKFEGSARSEFRNESSASDYAARAFSHIYLAK